MTTSDNLQAVAVTVTPFNDLDQLLPGELFEVTWAFRNEGDATWDEGILLVYSDESKPETADYPHTNLAAKDKYNLNELGVGAPIAPGDTVYLTLALTAPVTPGIYLTGWQLQSDAGLRFGPVRELRTIVIEPRAKTIGDFSYEVIEFQNSVPNYNNLPGETPFTGNWTLKNTSLDPWTGSFQVVYAADTTVDTHDAVGNMMGANAASTLHELTGLTSVPPDTAVTIPIKLTAPKHPGIYAFHWQLADEGGQVFGGTRWLRIIVAQPNGTAPSAPVHTSAYSYRGQQVQFFTGIHGPADDFMWANQSFQEMMQRLNMPVFFWSQGSNGNYAHFGETSRNAVRLYWNPESVSADRAYEYLQKDQLQPWWNRGYRRFIFFNEPQFGYAIAKIEEGMHIAWHNREQFALFLRQCLIRARQDFPDIKLYTTPMSSNEAFHPWEWRHAMWRQVEGLVDGWCMHAYSGNNDDAEKAAQNIADQVKELQRRFQLQIPIIISEASVNRGNDAEQKARVAHLLHQKLAQVPGAEGVFWYAADWNPDYDENKEGWFRNGIADAYLRQRS